MSNAARPRRESASPNDAGPEETTTTNNCQVTGSEISLFFRALTSAIDELHVPRDCFSTMMTPVPWRNIMKTLVHLNQSPSQTLQEYSRYIGIASTTTALLSARYLLLNVNFHYPLLLYCAQLGVATAVVTTSVLIERSNCRRNPIEAESSILLLPRLRCGSMVMGASMVFTALSTLCLLQAILWLYNLPTITMLAAVSYFVEDLLLLLTDLTPLSTLEASRILSLLLSCAGILVTDHRLAVKGLVPTISAMVFAGLAATLRRVARKYDPEDIPGRSAGLARYVIVGCIVAAIWPLCFPDEVQYMSKDLSLNLRTICLLLLHGLSATLSYLTGHALTVPVIRPEDTNTSTRVNLFPRLPDAATLLAVTGLVGNGTMFAVRRCFVSWPQLMCFVLAVISISCGKSSYLGTSNTPLSPSVPTYELAELSPLVSSEDIDPGDSDGTITPQSASRRAGRTASWLTRNRPHLISAGLIVLWISYATQNFSNPYRWRHQHVSWDKVYKAESQMEVVISMYKEPTEDVIQLVDLLKTEWQTSQPTFTVYIKDEEADVEKLLQRLGVDRIIPRPNVGRESETYLYHILENWDYLAFRTVFLQANVHNPREFTPRIKFFDPKRTGYLNLGWQDLCDCDSCGDKFFWRDSIGLYPDIHYQIHTQSCSQMSIAYKGQFIVSAARIRGVNRSIYDDLWQGLVNESSWAHQPEFLQGREDSMSAPHFGYGMERMWNLLFQCSQGDIAWKCPSLLSRKRIGGGIGDCQCFD